MRRWKRSAALAAALVLALGLCACGSSADSALPMSTPEPPSGAEEPEDTWQEEELWEEPEPEPETPTGLVMAGIDQGWKNLSIVCFDPDTNKEYQISNFSLNQMGEHDGYVLGFHSRLDFLSFSQDYTKVIADKSFTDGGGVRAGWLDPQGNFFDVTEAVGFGEKSDFDDRVWYYPVGFSENYFVFLQREAPRGSLGDVTGYYYVPVDNVTPEAVQRGNPFGINRPYEVSDSGECQINIPVDKYAIWHYQPANVTSWIDSTHCIANSNGDSILLDTEAKTISMYIPGNSRINWNGFISPDGERIAFMSKPKEGSEPTTDLYIIPVDSENPEKVTGHSFPVAAYNDGLEMSCGFYTLIGWI